MLVASASPGGEWFWCSAHVTTPFAASPSRSRALGEDRFGIVAPGHEQLVTGLEEAQQAADAPAELRVLASGRDPDNFTTQSLGGAISGGLRRLVEEIETAQKTPSADTASGCGSRATRPSRAAAAGSVRAG